MCIRLNNLGKWACDRLTEYDDIAKKKNPIFRWSSFWSWRACKQAKLWHLGHRKPARIHWKAVAPKTSHCLVRSLVQRHNWVIFLRKWAMGGCYSQWRSLSGHIEQILFTKIEEEDIGSIWFQQDGVSRSQSYTRIFAPCFWSSHYQPQSWCRLTTWELRFNTVGLLFVGWSKINVTRQARDNWRFKGQYSWSRWWNTNAHNR